MTINYIYNLAIEVSRKCNIKCSHCLRGNAQKQKNIDLNKLNSFLRNVEMIGTLTIAGGEPALSLDILAELKQIVMWSGVEIQNLYLVTNGLYKQEDLAQWFLDFTECICTDNSTSHYTVSYDKWHTEALSDSKKYKRDANYWTLKEEWFAHKPEMLGKHSDDSWTFQNIIKMGRAKDWGFRELEPMRILIENNDDRFEISEPEIYFTYNGFLFSSCDLSYIEMKKQSKFYIGEYHENLKDRIKSYNERNF